MESDEVAPTTRQEAGQMAGQGARPLEIAILMFEGMTASDAVAPYEMLRWLPGATVKFVAEEAGPKRTDSGFLTLMADYALEDVPHPDILVVPPPPAGSPSYGNERLLSWLRAAHETSQYTVSLCAGPLLLGAAGLLGGVRATTRTALMETLPQFGAIPAHGERYVRDGKIITATDFAAGSDMALYLAGLIAGEETAQAIQLFGQYDPCPPYDYATLLATPAVVARARAMEDAFVAATMARYGAQG